MQTRLIQHYLRIQTLDRQLWTILVFVLVRVLIQQILCYKLKQNKLIWNKLFGIENNTDVFIWNGNSICRRKQTNKWFENREIYRNSIDNEIKTICWLLTRKMFEKSLFSRDKSSSSEKNVSFVENERRSKFVERWKKFRTVFPRSTFYEDHRIRLKWNFFFQKMKKVLIEQSRRKVKIVRIKSSAEDRSSSRWKKAKKPFQVSLELKKSFSSRRTISIRKRNCRWEIFYGCDFRSRKNATKFHLTKKKKKTLSSNRNFEKKENFSEFDFFSDREKKEKNLVKKTNNCFVFVFEENFFFCSSTTKQLDRTRKKSIRSNWSRFSIFSHCQHRKR